MIAGISICGLFFGDVHLLESPLCTCNLAVRGTIAPGYNVGTAVAVHTPVGTRNDVYVIVTFECLVLGDGKAGVLVGCSPHNISAALVLDIALCVHILD